MSYHCGDCEVPLTPGRPCVIDGCHNETAWHAPGYPDCTDRCDEHQTVLAEAGETVYALKEKS